MIKKARSKWINIPLTVKVSTSYAICSILQKCLSFITLPLFTRLLTTDQYGQYTVYQSWSSILTIFLTLNLAYGSFATAMVKFEQERDGYISSIQGICLSLTALFLAVYLPFRATWNRWFELPTFLVLVMLAEILTSTATQLWTGKKQFEFRYKCVIAVTMLNAVAAPLLAYLLVMHTEEKGYARILGYAGTAIIIGGLFFIHNLIQGKKLWSKAYWKYALSFNIPLLAYYLSQVIFNQSDRIMISHYCGTSKAAMYGVAYNLALVLNFVLNAINNSYVPWFYGKLKTGKTEENKTVSCGIAILMALMLLCIIWYAPEIIRLMAGSQYTEAIGVVAPIAMSLLLLFYSQLFINVEFYYEEKHLLVAASIGSAVVNIVLNALLIPRFTFVAAGYTTLVSYILFAACNYFAMKRVLKKRGLTDHAYSMKGLLSILVLFILSSFLGMALYGSLIPRIAITVIVFAVMLVFRKRLLGVFQTIKHREKTDEPQNESEDNAG